MSYIATLTYPLLITSNLPSRSLRTRKNNGRSIIDKDHRLDNPHSEPRTKGRYVIRCLRR